MEPYKNLDLVNKVNDNNDENIEYLKSTIRTKNINKNNSELNLDLIN